MAPTPWSLRVASLVSRVERKARYVAPRVGQEGGEDDLSQAALLVLLESSPFRQTSRGEYLSRLDDGALVGWAVWQAVNAIRRPAYADLDDATPAPTADADLLIDAQSAYEALEPTEQAIARATIAGYTSREVCEWLATHPRRVARVRAALAAAV